MSVKNNLYRKLHRGIFSSCFQCPENAVCLRKASIIRVKFFLVFLTGLVLLGNHSLLLLHLDSLLIAFWSKTFSMNCHIPPHCYNFTLIMLLAALLPAAFGRSG